MTLRRAFSAQLFACLCVYVLITFQLLPKQSLLGLALVQGGFAAAFTLVLRGEIWWLFIHAGFMPALVLTSGLQLHPAWFLAAFCVLALVYWNAFRSQVPLYLSNQTTVTALTAWVQERHAGLVVDLGCGTGSFITRLAQQCPEVSCVGIESAPIPWLLARWHARHLPNCLILRQDFWPYSLERADVVYAFLSPVPMPRLWQKACSEMKPEAWLISNSFTVPEVSADEVHVLADPRETHLYFYQPAKERK